ncbi:hypothetical protein PMAC_002947 [Pneumocystis sp. 'macacae']|nr:hypothetical protein PMAC_002947 [Pneumocystis sp. 'macacae']
MSSRADGAHEEQRSGACGETGGPSELVVVDVVMSDGSSGSGPKTLSVGDGVKLVGLDTPTPFLEWGRQVYRGRWEEMVGTELVFDGSAELVGQSRRRLVMERVRLVRRRSGGGQGEEEAAGVGEGEGVEGPVGAAPG